MNSNVKNTLLSFKTLTSFWLSLEAKWIGLHLTWQIVTFAGTRFLKVWAFERLTKSGNARPECRLKSCPSVTFAIQFDLRVFWQDRWWEAGWSCSLKQLQRRRKDCAQPRRERFQCNLKSRFSSTPMKLIEIELRSHTWCWWDQKKCLLSWCNNCTEHHTVRLTVTSSWSIHSLTSPKTLQLTIHSS